MTPALKHLFLLTLATFFSRRQETGKIQNIYAMHKYRLGEEWLVSSPAAGDLGMLAVSRLSVSQHCAKRANPILGCIKHQPAKGAAILL